MVAEGAGTSPPYEGIDGSGTDIGRILSLSDGIFAFAMTLLVLNLALPAVGARSSAGSVFDYLNHLGNQLLIYILAFMVIFGWWNVHHRIFSAIRRYDPTLLRLNTLFLLLISIVPFTLALVFAFGPIYFLDRGISAEVSVAMFGTIEVGTGLVLFGIWRHATSGHLLVDPSLPPEWIGYAEQIVLIRVVVFGISVGLAFALPVVGELVWAGAILQRRYRRSPPRVAPGALLPTG